MVVVVVGVVVGVGGGLGVVGGGAPGHVLLVGAAVVVRGSELVLEEIGARRVRVLKLRSSTLLLG
jgi:hypothetical protein